MLAQSNGAAHDGVTTQPASGLSRFQQVLRVLDLTVDLLIARTSMGDCWSAGFRDAEHYLGALPLPSPDFARAQRHLQNAAIYCEKIEFGAAAFELRSLRGQLHQL